MVVKIERMRYVLVEFYPNSPGIGILISQLRRKVAEISGQVGLAKSALHVEEIVSNYAIIRSNHKYRDVIEAAIQLLEINDTIPTIRIISGSIKKINKFIDA